MTPWVRYTTMRLLLLLLVALVLYAVGARGFLLIVLAALISAALSYLLLRGQRDALALRIAQRVEGRAVKGKFEKTIDADNAAEDADAGRGKDGQP